MARPAPGSVTTSTVLSTDIVGSTETRIRLGEERADRHFGNAYRLLLSVATVSGATFTRSLGDGLLAVFDSVMAGMNAALAVERELAAENRRAAEPIAIRTALSVGDLKWTESDVEGLPLNEAARLVGMAAGGQVLCTDTVRRLSSRGPGCGFRELGPKTVKGLSEPLEVHEIRWDDAGRPEPLPPWLGADHLLPLVGRDAELGALKSELQAARHATRRIHVQGEQGEGKTRLMSVIARTALDSGFIVMAGRCHNPARQAHEPIAAAVQHLARTHPAQLLRAQADDQCARLAHLAPALAEVPRSATGPVTAEPASDRAQLVAAVRALIERVAGVRPVLLLIDDLQWASAESLQILRALRWDDPSPPRLLILTTSWPVRPPAEDPAGQDAAAAELRRLQAEGKVVDTRSLGSADIAEAISTVDLPAGSGRDAGRLHQITGGNAFLVTEVVRELLSGKEPGTTAVPDSVKQMVRVRLDQLGPQARRMTELLAVGERLPAGVLRAGTGLDDDRFVETQMELTAAGLLTRAPHLHFQLSHELTRKAVYAALPPPRAGLLHGRVADLLLQSDPEIIESRPYVIATHLLAAVELGHDAARVAKAAEAAMEAARQAMARLAHSEAVTWYQRLLAQLAKDPSVPAGRHAETLLECGRAMWLAGDPEARPMLENAAERARECERSDLVVAAAVTGDRGFFSRTAAHDPERIKLLNEALQLTGTADRTTRAVLTAQLASELTWAPDAERRLVLSDQAVALARESGDLRTLVRVLGLRSLTIVPAVPLEQRHREAEEMLEAARRTGDDLLLFHATFQRIAPLLDTGDTSELTRYLEKAEELAGRLAQPHLTWLVGFSTAGLSLMRGNLAEAEAESRRARRLGREIGRDHEATPFKNEQIAEIRRLQGRLEEKRGLFRDAVHFVDADPANVVLRYLCELGDDLAGPLLDEIIAKHGPMPRRNLAHRPALDNLAFAAARLRRKDLIEPLYEAMMSYADTFGHSTVARHCGHHYLAHLSAAIGEAPRAAGHFAAAAAVHERCGVPLLMAESLLDWADLADSSADCPPAPRTLPERCAELLAGRGAALLERRLTGLRPPS